MPLIIICSEYKRQYPLSEQERKVFWSVSKEERANVLCLNCEKKKKGE